MVSASHGSAATEAFVAKYKGCKKVERGSSLKLLMVAEGTAHVYPRLAPTMEWDTCAAQAIVEVAGGKVRCTLLLVEKLISCLSKTLFRG